MSQDDDFVKEFIKHLFPRVVLRDNLRLRYTFCFGGLAFTALLVLIVSGALLLFHYLPTSDGAFRSILHLESRVPAGGYIRNLHRLSANTFLVLLFLHTLRVIFTGAYRKPRELNWVIGFVILCLALFEGYTGYLLPMDQLALWATQTGMNLLGTVPLAGAFKAFLVPDAVGQPLSLMRFYVLHVAVIPLSMLILCMLHFYRIRKDKGVLPYL